VYRQKEILGTTVITILLRGIQFTQVNKAAEVQVVK
jgi:hypothetical protein